MTEKAIAQMVTALLIVAACPTVCMLKFVIEMVIYVGRHQ